MPIAREDIVRQFNGSCGQLIVYYPNAPSGPPEKANILVPLDSTTRISPSVWKPLPLASRLGVDLVYITKDDSDHEVFGPVGNYRNTTIEVLTTECDPSSEAFGKAGQKARGGVLFKWRDDAVVERLTRAPTDSLELFITERLSAIKAALANDGLEAAKEEYAKMTPVEFRKYFKRYRSDQAEKYTGMGWEKQTCPVNVDGDRCETCGAEKDDEKALMRCGKCKKVMYCGKECQQEDWKDHKPFCRRV